MKKVFLFNICLILFLFMSCNSLPENNEESEMVPYKTVEMKYRDVIYPESISNLENLILYSNIDTILEDLDWFMANTSVNYDDAVEKGYDLQLLKKSVKSEFKDKSTIDTNEFVLFLRNELLNFFEDYHSAIFGINDWRVPLCIPYKLMYSNIYVEKRGDDYFVIESDNNSVKIGMKYCDKENCLFYYPVKGKNTYRIGYMFPEEYFIGAWNVSMLNGDISLSFDDKITKIQLKVDQPLGSRQTLRYNEIESKDSVYISLSSFGNVNYNSIYRKGTDKNFEKWFEAPVKFHDKKNIIIDLRSNCGGELNNVDLFISGLFTNRNSKEDLYDTQQTSKKIEEINNEFMEKSTIVTSYPKLMDMMNVIKNYNPENKALKNKTKREIRKYKKNPVKNYYKYNKVTYLGTVNLTYEDWYEPYNGKIYFIVDTVSASASELIIAKARYIFGKNVYVLGQNTRGCLSYGDVRTYVLDGGNSNIPVSLCSMDFPILNEVKGWKGEGKGFYPDFWCSYEDLQETIRLVTEDDEIADKLQYIGYSLQ